MRTKLILLVSVLCLLFVVPVQSGTCSGTASCTACKNCRYCKHCSKLGGSCGVCAPKATVQDSKDTKAKTGLPADTTAKKKKRKKP